MYPSDLSDEEWELLAPFFQRPYSLRKQWRKNGDKAYYICHERLPPRVDLRMSESLNLTLGQGSRFVG